MKTLVILTTAVALLSLASAFAQDPVAMPDTMTHSGTAAALPAACEAAASKMDMSKMMGGMMPGGAMGAVETANMQAMYGMHATMMKTASIKDADLAFNCGMIAHHQGAIAMAKVELEMGKDAASKAMAAAIIAAQEAEIANMTAWIEAYAK